MFAQTQMFLHHKHSTFSDLQSNLRFLQLYFLDENLQKAKRRKKIDLCLIMIIEIQEFVILKDHNLKGCIS